MGFLEFLEAIGAFGGEIGAKTFLNAGFFCIFNEFFRYILMKLGRMVWDYIVLIFIQLSHGEGGGRRNAPRSWYEYWEHLSKFFYSIQLTISACSTLSTCRRRFSCHPSFFFLQIFLCRLSACCLESRPPHLLSEFSFVFHQIWQCQQSYCELLLSLRIQICASIRHRFRSLRMPLAVIVIVQH